MSLRRWQIVINYINLASIAVAQLDRSLQPLFPSELIPRQACTGNNVFDVFLQNTQDSIPYCSSLLGIQDQTITVDSASATGNISHASTTFDVPTITIRQRVQCSGDSTDLTSDSNSGPIGSYLADAATNTAVASEVSSACSCLDIQPKTVDVTAVTEGSTIEIASTAQASTVESLTISVATAELSSTFSPALSSSLSVASSASSSITQASGASIPSISQGGNPRTGSDSLQASASSSLSSSISTPGSISSGSLSSISSTSSISPATSSSASEASSSEPATSSISSSSITSSGFQASSTSSSQVLNASDTSVSAQPPNSTSTSISSQVASTSSTSPIPSALDRSFLIAFQGPVDPPLNNPGLSRRSTPVTSAPYYVTFDGSITDSCLESAEFTLTTDTQLFANGKNLYSTFTGTQSQLFTPSTQVGDISTGWMDISNAVQWRNASFLNAYAPLCAQSGFLYLYFLEEIPAGCFPILPEILSVSECTGYRENTTSMSQALGMPTSMPTSSGTQSAPSQSTISTVPSNSSSTSISTNSTDTSTAVVSDETFVPIGYSINPLGCPTINNTNYTDDMTVPTTQIYQIQCFRTFTGPNYQALAEPHFKECIQACDNLNGGGSAFNGGQPGLFCYGVTWLWYAGGIDSMRCLLKTQEGLNQSIDNEMLAVSAVLLTGVPEPVVAAYGG